MQSKYPTLNFYIMLILILIISVFIYIGNSEGNTFANSISGYPNVKFTINKERVINAYDSIASLMQNDRRYYWKVVSDRYLNTKPNKANLKTFLHETLNISTKEKKHNLSYKKRKFLNHRTLHVARIETGYGRAGTGKNLNNIVGRKIHGKFYKWGAERGYCNYAKFGHWTHSVLFYYEKVLSHKHKRRVA